MTIRQLILNADNAIGRILYVEDAKTQAGNRAVEIPKVLYEILKHRIGERQPLELLFPNERGNVHHRSWVRENAMRLCGFSRVGSRHEGIGLRQYL